MSEATDKPHIFGESFAGNTLAWLMVGNYFQEFATTERYVDRCIQKALKLGILQGAVVQYNLDLQRKLQLLRALIDLAPYDLKKDKRFDTAIVKFMDELELRNYVAHNEFWPTDDGKGVKFYVVKAKKKYESPDVSWHLVEYQRIVDRIDNCRQIFKELADAFDKINLEAEARKGDMSSGLFGGIGSAFSFVGSRTQGEGILSRAIADYESRSGKAEDEAEETDRD